MPGALHGDVPRKTIVRALRASRLRWMRAECETQRRSDSAHRRIEPRGGVAGKHFDVGGMIQSELNRGFRFVRVLGKKSRSDEQLSPFSGRHHGERLFRAGYAPPMRSREAQHPLDRRRVARVTENLRVPLGCSRNLRSAGTHRKVDAHEHARRECGRDGSVECVRGVRRTADHCDTVIVQQFLKPMGDLAQHVVARCEPRMLGGVRRRLPAGPAVEVFTRRVTHVVGVPAVPMRVQLLQVRQLAAMVAVQRGRARVDHDDDDWTYLFERAYERSYPRSHLPFDERRHRRRHRSVEMHARGGKEADPSRRSNGGRYLVERLRERLPATVKRLPARLRLRLRPGARIVQRVAQRLPPREASSRVGCGSIDVHAEHWGRPKLSRQTAELIVCEQCVWSIHESLRDASTRFSTSALLLCARRRGDAAFATGVRRKRIEQCVPRRILSATLPTSSRDAPRPWLVIATRSARKSRARSTMAGPALGATRTFVSTFAAPSLSSRCATPSRYLLPLPASAAVASTSGAAAMTTPTSG